PRVGHNDTQELSERPTRGSGRASRSHDRAGRTGRGSPLGLGVNEKNRNASCSVERIVPKRKEGDVVVGSKSLVRRSRSGRKSRECGQFHKLVLKPGPHPAHIALVQVLPEADRELLCLLDIESTGEAGNRRIEAAECATRQ